MAGIEHVRPPAAGRRPEDCARGRAGEDGAGAARRCSAREMDITWRQQEPSRAGSDKVLLTLVAVTPDGERADSVALEFEGLEPTVE